MMKLFACVAATAALATTPAFAQTGMSSGNSMSGNMTCGSMAKTHAAKKKTMHKKASQPATASGNMTGNMSH